MSYKKQINELDQYGADLVTGAVSSVGSAIGKRFGVGLDVNFLTDKGYSAVITYLKSYSDAISRTQLDTAQAVQLINGIQRTMNCGSAISQGMQTAQVSPSPTQTSPSPASTKSTEPEEPTPSASPTTPSLPAPSTGSTALTLRTPTMRADDIGRPSSSGGQIFNTPTGLVHYGSKINKNNNAASVKQEKVPPTGDQEKVPPVNKIVQKRLSPPTTPQYNVLVSVVLQVLAKTWYSYRIRPYWYCSLNNNQISILNSWANSVLSVSENKKTLIVSKIQQQQLRKIIKDSLAPLALSNRFNVLYNLGDTKTANSNQAEQTEFSNYASQFGMTVIPVKTSKGVKEYAQINNFPVVRLQKNGAYLNFIKENGTIIPFFGIDSLGNIKKASKKLETKILQQVEEIFDKINASDLYNYSDWKDFNVQDEDLSFTKFNSLTERAQYHKLNVIFEEVIKLV